MSTPATTTSLVVPWSTTRLQAFCHAHVECVSRYPAYSYTVVSLSVENRVKERGIHKDGPRRRIPVFRPCVVEPLQFLQSVCAYNTLAVGTP